jgi:eukaryotic-like serine/threonine-protein kinase
MTDFALRTTVTDPDDLTLKRGVGSSSKTQVFALGYLVAGRYEIVRVIGVGGASHVYEAVDTGLGVNVALKVLDPIHAQNAVQLERFRREIQTARKVTHRNVCRIFDLGVERMGNSKRFFLTMELLSGSSMDVARRKGRRYTAAEALPIVAQIAEGLQAAHDAGVVHRDLKPANIMLVEPSSAGGSPSNTVPRAVITDFGLAVTHEHTRLTRSDELVGTPAYMAPEQAELGEITAAADIYALGLIMYEMLAGVRPFEAGATPVETVLLRKEVPAQPLRQVLPDVDPRWETTIHRCLRPEPGERFARALDIVASLSGEPPSRKPPRSRA